MTVIVQHTDRPVITNVSHIIESWHFRPVLRQHRAAERIYLALRDDRHAGPTKAEVEKADSAEE
jgi:hypothetical protein